MINPNPIAESATRTRFPTLAPIIPANAVRNPKRPPLLMHDSMTGPGLADTIKVMEKNKLKFVIGIHVLSTKVAILVEPVPANQHKLAHLTPAPKILFYTQYIIELSRLKLRR